MTTGGATPTQVAQIELILNSVREVGAFPSGWRDSDRGVEYLYRKGCIVVRDWHLERVLAAVRELLPDRRVTTEDVVAGATRIHWSSWDDGPTVQEVLRQVDQTVSRKAAAPDYLVYVCAHSCAAIEPEATSATEPSPPPRSAHGYDPTSWGLGEGVKVLVFDTGLVDDAARDHGWLSGVTGEPDNPYRPNPSPPPAELLAQDAGHGTFTAGCVRVTAPRADVRVVNAASILIPNGPDPSPIGALFDSQLATLIRDQLIGPPGGPAPDVPDILLVNFAGTTEDGGPPLALAALYDDLLQHMGDVLMLSPAGNEGDTRKNWPGAFSWVVSVGALNERLDDRASWSNHGPTVDVYAPGERLTNAYAKGLYRYAWEYRPAVENQFDGMAIWSGTSFATPLVAGLVAARMSATGENSQQAWLALQQIAQSQAIPSAGPRLFANQT